MQMAMPSMSIIEKSRLDGYYDKENKQDEHPVITKKTLEARPATHYIYTLLAPICNVVDRVAQRVLILFSAKHSVRPSNILSCCYQVSPFFKEYFSAIIDKGCIALHIIDPKKEFSNELNALHLLHAIGQGLADKITDEDTKAIGCLLKKVFDNDTSLKRFARMLNTEENKHFLATYKKLCNMAQLNADRFAIISDKIKCLSAQPDPSLKLPTLNKININEFAMLMDTQEICPFLEKISNAVQGFPELSTQYHRWKHLDEIYQGPFITKLRQLWLQANPPGTIFLGNFHTYLHQGLKIEFPMVLAHIYNGPMAHAGILVDTANGKRGLSHLSGGRQNILTLRDPLLHAFHHTISIDITSLLPKEISAEDQQTLKNVFHDKFLELSHQSRPDITSATGFIARASLLLFGHKQLAKQELADIHLDPGERQICSSYVANIFLQALHHVNLKIEKLGYINKIEHPFGRHENIFHIDILRLLYLWKQSKLIKVNTYPPEIEQAIPTGNTTCNMASFLEG